MFNVLLGQAEQMRQAEQAEQVEQVRQAKQVISAIKLRLYFAFFYNLSEKRP
jgi:hypothetical protein